MKTIVLGLDGVSEADRTLERAATITEAFDSKLIVVVVEPIPAIPLAGITDSAMASAAIPEQSWSRELLIEQARSSLGARDLDYEIVSPAGDAGAEIIAVADEVQADLIVVRSANAGFFERWFLGSVSDSVVRSAHRDVLLVADNPAEH